MSYGGARRTQAGPATRSVRAGLAVLLASLTAAGCAGGSDPKPPENAQSGPPPAQYKAQIAAFLRTTLVQRADFQGTLIGAPALKPVGQSQHYVVCLKFSPRSEFKEKVVIYLGQSIAQFIDANPGQCADAAYQPFQDLEDMMPPK